MPLSPAFSVTQELGSPSVLTITDDSTGSDGTITQRRVYLQKEDGTYLTPADVETDYIPWPIADDEIEIDCLDRDYAVTALVQWLNVSNVVVQYTSEPVLLPIYTKATYINLIKAQSSRRTLVDHANFYQNLIKLICCIKDAESAILLAQDISSAQAALDRAKKLVDNPSYFY